MIFFYISLFVLLISIVLNFRNPGKEWSVVFLILSFLIFIIINFAKPIESKNQYLEIKEGEGLIICEKSGEYYSSLFIKKKHSGEYDSITYISNKRPVAFKKIIKFNVFNIELNGQDEYVQIFN